MIRVEISNGKLNPVNHDVTIGSLIMEALKSAGIPAIGSAFVLRGIEHGKLTYEMNDMRTTHIMTWREDDNDRDVKFIRTASKDGCTVYKSGKHAEDDEL